MLRYAPRDVLNFNCAANERQAFTMSRRTHLLSPVLALTLAGCAAPSPSPSPAPATITWTEVPLSAAASGLCGRGEPTLTLCEYVWASQAFVVAEIESATVVWDPLVASVEGENGLEVFDVEVDECVVIAPALELKLRLVEQLSGPSLVSETFTARIVPERLRLEASITTPFPEAQLAWSDLGSYFSAGSRSLLSLHGVQDASDAFFLRGQFVGVESDRIVAPDVGECDVNGPYLFDGIPVDEFLQASRACGDSDRAQRRRELLAPRSSPDALEAAVCYRPIVD